MESRNEWKFLRPQTQQAQGCQGQDNGQMRESNGTSNTQNPTQNKTNHKRADKWYSEGVSMPMAGGLVNNSNKEFGGTQPNGSNSNGRHQVLFSSLHSGATRKILKPEDNKYNVISSVHIHNGDLSAFVTSDLLPRRFVGVKGSVRFNNNFRNMVLDIQSRVHKRDEENFKCTMLTQSGKRHLRQYVKDVGDSKIYKYRRYSDTGEPFSNTIIKSLGATKYQKVREALYKNMEVKPAQEITQLSDEEIEKKIQAKYQEEYDNSKNSNIFNSSYQQAILQKRLRQQSKKGKNLNYKLTLPDNYEKLLYNIQQIIKQENLEIKQRQQAQSKSKQKTQQKVKQQVVDQKTLKQNTGKDAEESSGAQFDLNISQNKKQRSKYKFKIYSQSIKPKDTSLKKVIKQKFDAQSLYVGAVNNEFSFKTLTIDEIAQQRELEQQRISKIQGSNDVQQLKGKDQQHQSIESEQNQDEGQKKQAKQKAKQEKQEPTGGHIKIHMELQDFNEGMPEENNGNLNMTVDLDNIHAPLFERLLEIPIDIYEGTGSGRIILKSYDKASWKFPSIYGNLHVKEGGFHIWDSPDDFSKVNFDMQFDNQKALFNEATATFGAVPIQLKGEMDLNVENGSYRLSANAFPVDCNCFRATFGVKPTPQQIGGFLIGKVHCSGNLDEPIFQGRVQAVNSPQLAYIQNMEPGNARDIFVKYINAQSATTAQNPPTQNVSIPQQPPIAKNQPKSEATQQSWRRSRDGSVKAGNKQPQLPYFVFDKVPLDSVEAIFTVDTSLDILRLHEAHGLVTGGGEVFAQGKLWLSPEAEIDPSAIQLIYQARNVNFPKLIQPYISNGQEVKLPSIMEDISLSQVSGNMTGPYLSPTITSYYDIRSNKIQEQLAKNKTNASILPKTSIVGQGDLQLKRKSIDLKVGLQNFEMGIKAKVEPPTFKAINSVTTQEDVTNLSKLNITDLDLKTAANGINIKKLVMDQDNQNQDKTSEDNQQESQLWDHKNRALLYGKAQMNGRFSNFAQFFEKPTLQDNEGQTLINPDYIDPSFAGNLSLKSVKFNNQQLANFLQGKVKFADNDVKLQLKGSEATEKLHVNVSLPPKHDANSLENQQQTQAQQTNPSASSQVTDSILYQFQKAYLNLGTIRDRNTQRLQQVHLEVQELPLNFLNLPEFQGVVQNLDLNLDLQKQAGKFNLNIQNPRLFGLYGKQLTTNASLSDNQLKLRKASFQQQISAYDLKGELQLSEEFSNFVEQSLQQTQTSNSIQDQEKSRQEAGQIDITDFQPPAKGNIQASPTNRGDKLTQQAPQNIDIIEVSSEGNQKAVDLTTMIKNWKSELSIPYGGIEDLVPALSFFEQSYGSYSDTAKMKVEFLEKIKLQQIEYNEFVNQVKYSHIENQSLDQNMVAGDSQNLGLQDVKGKFSGVIKAGGSNLNSVSDLNFNVNGENWSLGQYKIQQVKATGQYDQQKGIRIQELSMKSGKTFLRVNGDIATQMNMQNNFQINLRDFPIETLQPLTQSMSNEVEKFNKLAEKWIGQQSKKRSKIFNSSKLKTIADQVSNTAQDAVYWVGAQYNSRVQQQMRGGKEADAKLRYNLYGYQPFRGQLQIKGHLKGTALKPEGFINAKILEGFIGENKLAISEAKLDFRHNMAHYNINLLPSQLQGRIAINGQIPLQPFLNLQSQTNITQYQNQITQSEEGEGQSSGGDQGPSNKNPEEEVGREVNELEKTQQTSQEQQQQQHKPELGRQSFIQKLIPGTKKVQGDESGAGKVQGDGTKQGLQSQGSGPLQNLDIFGIFQRPQVNQNVASINLQVQDHGVKLLGSFLPGVAYWNGGQADIQAQASIKIPNTIEAIDMNALQLSGRAYINKGYVVSPLLKDPITNLALQLNFDKQQIVIDEISAKLGSQGSVDIKGKLPYREQSIQDKSKQERSKNSYERFKDNRLNLNFRNIDLRIPVAYTGQLDTQIVVQGALDKPVVGGYVQFCKGSFQLLQQGDESNGYPQAFSDINNTNISQGNNNKGNNQRNISPHKAFKALISSPYLQEARYKLYPLVEDYNQFGVRSYKKEEVKNISEQNYISQEQAAIGQEISDDVANFKLDRFKVIAGPDLKAVYSVSQQVPGVPPIMSINFAGKIEFDGYATQDHLKAQGSLQLERGYLNLVATQLILDRERSNQISFTVDSKLDPFVDVAFVGQDFRTSIKGRASKWQEYIVIQRGKGEDQATLKSGEAANILQSQLSTAILEENGQISVAKLAASTINSLMPRMETSGSIGIARWRLISAPYIPGLIQPTSRQNTNLLTTIASGIGTEVEMSLGKNLVTTVQKKILTSAQVGLNYAINNRWKIQTQCSFEGTYPHMIVLQFQSR